MCKLLVIALFKVYNLCKSQLNTIFNFNVHMPWLILATTNNLFMKVLCIIKSFSGDNYKSSFYLKIKVHKKLGVPTPIIKLRFSCTFLKTNLSIKTY